MNLIHNDLVECLDGKSEFVFYFIIVRHIEITIFGVSKYFLKKYFSRAVDQSCFFFSYSKAIRYRKSKSRFQFTKSTISLSCNLLYQWFSVSWVDIPSFPLVLKMNSHYKILNLFSTNRNTASSPMTDAFTSTTSRLSTSSSQMSFNSNTNQKPISRPWVSRISRKVQFERNLTLFEWVQLEIALITLINFL